MKIRQHAILVIGFILIAVGIAVAADLNSSGRCPSSTSCNIGESTTTSITLTADGGTCTSDGNLSCTGNDMGWAVVAGANTACTTTCTSACIFGVNTAATEADIVNCADATADECLCAGAT
jgi:hypothetical protein